MVISPGKLEINLMAGDNDGRISKIVPNGLAQKLGLKLNWRVVRLNGRPYNYDQLIRLAEGDEEYEIEFEKYMSLNRSASESLEDILGQASGEEEVKEKTKDISEDEDEDWLDDDLKEARRQNEEKKKLLEQKKKRKAQKKAQKRLKKIQNKKKDGVRRSRDQITNAIEDRFLMVVKLQNTKRKPNIVQGENS